jgi:hypothetical protein
MKLILLVAVLVAAVAAAWVGAVKLNKKGLLKDENNNNVPDIVDDKIEEVKQKVKKAVKNKK